MKEVLRVYWFLLFLFLVTSLAHGQVRRDSTARIRFGTALPATCNPSIGSVFFLITPGSPLGMHQCLATDSYTAMVGSMSGAGVDNQVAVFTGPTDIEGTSAFTFDSSTGLLGLVNDTASVQMGAALDAQMHRDDADIRAQRRGANPQEWRLYDNFVSSVDFDRLAVYIGGGPPLKTIEFVGESTDATQAINILIEALSNAFGEGSVTLLAGTSGGRLAIQPSSAGSGAQFTGGGLVTFSEDIRLTGLIASVGLIETTPGVGLFMTIAGVAAPGFRDSHSIDLQGVGGGASRSTWRTFVDILNIGADSIYTLQVDKPFGGGFTDIMTIDDSSDVVIANSGLTLTGPLASFTATPEFPGGTPITGLLLDTVPFTSVGQRDSDAIIQVGQAHDGAVSRSTRWKWFVDVTNNSANSTLRLQHSIAGQAFIDHLLVDQTGSLILARTSPRLFFGDSLDVILRRDTEGNGELGFRNGTNPQVFNIYNTFTADANNEFGEIGWKPVSNTFVIGTVKGSSGGTARPMVLRTDELNALVIDTSQNVTITNDLVVSGAGPHSIAGVTSGAIQLLIGSTFTSDGSSDIASGIFHTPAIVGAPGDTTSLTGTTLTAGITTQTATESISTISQLQINEPFITDNLTGSILTAQTLLINGTPTEGNLNLALRSTGEGGMLIRGQQFQLGVSSMLNNTQVRIAGATFTSGGFTDEASKFRVEGVMTGAPGDTDFLAAISVHMTTIVTQTATETIDDITTLKLDEPIITDNLTGDITNASTLLITGAPTEGVSNFAILVDSGATLLGGPLEHTGTTLGFFSTTPATQPAAYTRNATIVESRTLLASASATALNNNNVLAALIADLQSLGLIQ
jgi:hypothetical protein